MNSNNLPTDAFLDHGEVNQLGLADAMTTSAADDRKQSDASVDLPQSYARRRHLCCWWSSRGVAYKNVFGVSLSFMACFSAWLGSLNLQATFNGEVGLYALVIVNGVWVLSSLISPTIIRLVGTKYCMICGYAGFLIFTIANYYPVWATLVPSGILLGLALGPLFASMLAHVTTIAITHAPAMKEQADHLVPVFTGIFSFHTQCSQILGNLVSSIILTSGVATIEDMSAPNICNHTVEVQLPEYYRHIITSVYVLFDITGIVIAFLLIDKLPLDYKFMSVAKMFREYFTRPVMKTLRTLVHWKSLLLLPMTLLNGMILAYLSGTFANVFVSRCVGVQWVGFVIVSYGVTSALNSLVTGRLVKHIPDYWFIYGALAVNVGLMLFLTLWERQPSYAAVFVFALGWGVTVGVWNTLVPGITGLLFSDRQEAGFGVNRMWYALGFTVGYVTSLLLSVSAQQWFYIAVMIISCLSYTLLIALTKKKWDFLPYCYSKPVHDDSNHDTHQDTSL